MFGSLAVSRMLLRTHAPAVRRLGAPSHDWGRRTPDRARSCKVLGFQQGADPQPDQPQPDQPSMPRVAQAQDTPPWVMEIKKDLEIVELKLMAELKLQAVASDAKLDKFAAASDAKLDKFAAASDAKLDKIAAEFRLWFFTLVAVLIGLGVKDLLPLFKL